MKVRVTITAICDIEVDAKDEDEAVEIALQTAEDETFELILESGVEWGYEGRVIS